MGSLGALQLQQESGPLPTSTITSAYDELGRLSARTVAGAGAESFQYDALGRLTGRSNDLGAFTLGYLGQTDQVTTRQLASSTLATTWSYLNNAGDRRLAGIANVESRMTKGCRLRAPAIAAQFCRSLPDLTSALSHP